MVFENMDEILERVRELRDKAPCEGDDECTCWRYDQIIDALSPMGNSFDLERKSVLNNGMTRYELCWDELHSQMVKQSQTIHGGGWPVFVLDRMERIENEILGPQED